MQRIEITYEDEGSITFNYPQEIHDNISRLLKLCAANKMAEKMLIYLSSTKDNLEIYFTEERLISLGQCLPEVNRIEIRSQLSFENLLKTFIFECSNACNPKFNEINAMLFSSDVEYANYMEESEYDSYVLAYNIFMHGIENAGWPKPDNMSSYIESLSKEVWMKKSKTMNDKYNGVQSHFEIYTSFYASKVNAIRQDFLVNDQAYICNNKR